MSKISLPLQVRIVLLILFITIINYIDRSAISYAIEPIEKELHISDLQFGLIGSVFSLGYLAASFLGGIVVDKFGSIRTWAAAAFAWSLATLAISFSQTLPSLLIFRVLLGVAEGIHFPALLKTVADWLPPKWRARSIAFSLAGVPLASLIGAPVTTLIILIFDWRKMFFILSLFGFLWVFLWLIFFRGRVNPHLGREKEWTPLLMAIQEPAIPLKKLFTSKSLLSSCLIYFVFGYTLFFGLTWLPGYLEKTHQVSIGDAGILIMAPWLFSSILVLCGGWISDFILKQTGSFRHGRTYTISAGMALAALNFYCLSRSHSLPLDLLFLSLGFGFLFFINAPIYALNIDLFSHRAASAQGVIIACSALGGLISPVLSGWLIQISGTFQMPLLFVALLCLIACLIALFFQFPDKKKNDNLSAL